MSSIDYINALAARGIELWTQDGKLQYKAPKEAVTPQLLAELKMHKATLIELLEQFAHSAGSYPLSYAQKSLWSLHQINADSAAYNVTYAAQLVDELDQQALTRCVDCLIARHLILRTRYGVVDGQPTQQVSTAASARLVVDKVFDADEAAIHDWIADEANKPFDLSSTPIRLKLLINALGDAESQAPRHVLLLNVHHIAADFWSLEIMVRELQALYAMAMVGQPLKLPPVRLQYKDCVQHEIERLQGPEGQALAAFWDDELRGPVPTLNLATDRMRPPVKTENGKVFRREFAADMSRSLKDASRALRVTPYMLLLGVYQLFLLLHTGQSRMFIGAPTAGRNLPGSEQVVGHFVNAVVLACEPQPNESFADLVARTRTMMLRVLDRQDYPFPLLVERMRPERDPSRSPLFQVMYNWNQLRARSSDTDAVHHTLFGDTLAASSTGTRGATHDLTLNIQDDGIGHVAAWTYNTDLFDDASVQRFAEQYLVLVEQVLADPQRMLSSYRLGLPSARADVLRRLAHAGEPAPASKVAWAARSRSAARRIVWQLQERLVADADVAGAVRGVRAKIDAAGIGAGSRVGVEIASAAELAVVMLALLDAGACLAWIGSDPGAHAIPEAPVDAIVRSASASWEAWDANSIVLVDVATPRPHPMEVDDGGAGARRIGSFIDGIGQMLALDGSSRVLLLHGTDLRLAASMLAAAAVRGASVHVPREPALADLCDPDAARATHAVQAIDVELALRQSTALAVPALLLPALAECSLDRLVSVLAYGDHPHVVERIVASRHAPAALRFVPSWCLDSWAGPVALSTPDTPHTGWRLEPVAGVVPLLLGPFMDLADDHQAGRLHLLVEPAALRGRDLASAPHQSGPQHDDLARALGRRQLIPTPLTFTRRDGELHCAQASACVSMHGATPVPIGAIESFFAAQPEVIEVACVLHETSPPNLTAYLRLASSHNAATAGEDLCRRLKHALPESMHPEAIVFVERMPLTPSGQLHSQRLPLPQLRSASSRSPVTEVERSLAAIWCEVLGRQEVGVDDDFFALGGDSILAAVIVSKAGLAGMYLQPRDLFEHTTIAGLARAVQAAPRIQAEQGSVSGEVVPGPAAAWFFEQFDIDRSHFNQALLVALHAPPDDALMQETLHLLAQQHDVLRSRFVQRDDGWHQVFDDDNSAVPVQWARVCCVGPDGRTSEDLWQQEIAAAQRALDIERGPLWAMRWLAAGTPAESRLLIVVHHLLIDGVSWSILLQDISVTYERLRAHAAAQRPLKTSSSKSWSEQWMARARSESIEVDRAYWLDHAERLRLALADGSSLALMQRGHALRARHATNHEAGSTAITLDAELTTAFRSTAHQAYGTDANDLLVAALHAGFQAWSGSTALLLDLEGHGRDALADTVDLSRSIGWFTSIYPVLLQAPAIEQPARLIKYVKERLRALPSKGASYGALRYLGADDTRQSLASLPPSPVLMTYLGQLDAVLGSSALYAGVVEPAPGIRSARQRRTHLLDICAYISDGQLTIECTFDGGPMVEDSIECLMRRMEQALIALIHHCCSDDAGGLTPSDVPDIALDQEALDALLEEVAALG